MLSNIKYYAMAFLGFLVVLFWGIIQSKNKEIAQNKLRNVKAARATEKRAVKALVEGLRNEQNAQSKPIDVVIRDHFSK